MPSSVAGETSVLAGGRIGIILTGPGVGAGGMVDGWELHPPISWMGESEIPWYVIIL